MNWFQRYGIPGAYSIILFGSLYWTFRGCQTPDDVQVKLILGIFAGGFLPAGYLCAVLGQATYYCVSPWRYHRLLSCFLVPPPGVERRKAWETEWWSEGEATARMRGAWGASPSDQRRKAGKWIQEWYTKRTDVLAISWSLLVATVFGLVAWVAVVVTCACCRLPWPNDWYWRYWPVPALAVALIVSAASEVIYRQCCQVFLSNQRLIARQYPCRNNTMIVQGWICRFWGPKRYWGLPCNPRIEETGPET